MSTGRGLAKSSFGGTWSAVAHSNDGINDFEETNLVYSSAEGTNVVIYFEADSATKFFRVQGR